MGQHEEESDLGPAAAVYLPGVKGSGPLGFAGLSGPGPGDATSRLMRWCSVHRITVSRAFDLEGKRSVEVLTAVPLSSHT